MSFEKKRGQPTTFAINTTTTSTTTTTTTKTVCSFSFPSHLITPKVGVFARVCGDVEHAGLLIGAHVVDVGVGRGLPALEGERGIVPGLKKEKRQKEEE
jgi:hypothetical protein